ncbi:hypothetical protein H0H92_001736 [Tricholoma furcatifolium]|nr:hypothetical protein H0H92_001736 [Tricholoma furcatifolium]
MYTNSSSVFYRECFSSTSHRATASQPVPRGYISFLRIRKDAKPKLALCANVPRPENPPAPSIVVKIEATPDVAGLPFKLVPLTPRVKLRIWQTTASSTSFDFVDDQDNHTTIAGVAVHSGVNGKRLQTSRDAIIRPLVANGAIDVDEKLLERPDEQVYVVANSLVRVLSIRGDLGDPDGVEEFDVNVAVPSSRTSQTKKSFALIDYMILRTQTNLVPYTKRLALKSSRMLEAVDEKAETASSGATDKKDPKVALSAFMTFSKEWRPKIKAENPEAGFGEVGMLVRAKWKQLSEEEKKPYFEQVAETKAHYDAAKSAALASRQSTELTHAMKDEARPEREGAR